MIVEYLMASYMKILEAWLMLTCRSKCGCSAFSSVFDLPAIIYQQGLAGVGDCHDPPPTFDL